MNDADQVFDPLASDDSLQPVLEDLDATDKILTGELKANEVILNGGPDGKGRSPETDRKGPGAGGRPARVQPRAEAVSQAKSGTREVVQVAREDLAGRGARWPPGFRGLAALLRGLMS